MITSGYRGLHRIKGIAGEYKGYRGLQGVTKGYKGLKRNRALS